MRNTASNFIYEFCKKNDKGYLIAGDAGYGVWDDFQKELPNQYINPGINEATCIGLASGMALSGHKVFYYNIIPFVLMRCYEQVRLDICYQNLPVILIGIGSGITYAPAGMTHYSVEDITLAKSMPNLDIFSPIDPIETKHILKYAIKNKKPTYIRIARSGEKNIHESVNIDITKPNFLQKGKDGILFIHGSIADEIKKLDSILKQKNINISIVSIPMLTSSYKYKKILKDYKHIFTLEEHFVDGGFGSILTDYCNKNDIMKKINKYGIKNEYIHKIGDRDYLRKHYKIDAKSVAKKMIKVIQNG